MNYTRAIVNFGSGAGPFLALSVPVRYKPHADNPHKAGPILSHWQVMVNDRWRNVWVSSGYPFPYATIEGERVGVHFQTD